MESRGERNEKKPISKMAKVFIWLSAILLLIVIAAAGIFAKVYKDTKNTVETIYEEIEQSEKRVETVRIEEKEPISILMLGVDEREDDRGRSDTMIVLTVNPELNNAKMISIPRDTRTEIIGYGAEDKINHAYAFGGIEMSRRTVENLLDIPIDYVVQVNMDSYKDIIDIVGGITIQNDFEFSYGGYDFPVGTLSLDGEEALAYVRMRYEDPNGDFGRQQRQKKVIQSVVKSAMSVDTALNYSSIFESLKSNVKLNASFDELMTLQSGYRESLKTIEQLTMGGGEDSMINEIYYYLPNQEEMQAIRSRLRTHLGMDQIRKSAIQSMKET